MKQINMYNLMHPLFEQLDCFRLNNKLLYKRQDLMNNHFGYGFHELSI